ncbi:hypothetical protein FGL66_00170 [Staphylococcus sp. 17KM0847]|nr:hypothetical protein FGL66_00170 [Staphylococcus sp. 17KM0847]
MAKVCILHFKKYLEKYGFIPLTIYTIIAGSLFMFIFLPGSFNELQTANMTSILSVIYLGAFPTVIPYIVLAVNVSPQHSQAIAS